MALEEWLAIMADGDAYIANGGKLLDIEMQSEAVLQAVAELLPSETWLRWGRFFSAIGAAGASNVRVGKVLSEEEARTIWGASADPEFKGAQATIH